MKEMSSISTLEIVWENNRFGRVTGRKEFLLELLKRINSSCSSGRERESEWALRLMGRISSNLEW